MTTIQTILTLILAPTFIVGGIVFVLRKFFEQLLSRDIEKFRAKLQAESEHAKLALANHLQAELFEFQTKFSVYHQKQAEVIGELYQMLSETQMVISQLVHPVQFDDGRTDDEKNREAFDKKVDLARFFEQRRIYLDEDLCRKVETVIKEMHKVLMQFKRSKMSETRRQGGTDDLEMWAEAFNTMEEIVPPLKTALEGRFRQLLSPNQADTTHGLEVRPDNLRFLDKNAPARE